MLEMNAPLIIVHIEGDGTRSDDCTHCDEDARVGMKTAQGLVNVGTNRPDDIRQNNALAKFRNAFISIYRTYITGKLHSHICTH